MTEVIGIYDSFFPSLKPGDQTTTLKMCIDAVISKYGQDIFDEEYNVNKDKFLQTLVNTRNRIMHIKRNQLTDKFLSGSESILYLMKLLERCTNRLHKCNQIKNDPAGAFHSYMVVFLLSRLKKVCLNLLGLANP